MIHSYALFILIISEALTLGHFTETDQFNRIIGGQEIDITEVPYNVYVIGRCPKGWLCSGVIISDKFILTAGHCLELCYSYEVQVRVGSSINIEGGTLHIAKKLSCHPNYNSTNHQYDIGIIELRDNLRFNDAVKPIPISDQPPVFGTNALITGYGVFEEKSNVTRRSLRMIEARVLSRKDCERYVHPKDLSDQVICTYNKGKTGPSHSDSGAPVVQNGKVFGIVSQGYKPPHVNTYLVDPEIRSYIREITGV